MTYFDSTFREILELQEARKETMLGSKEYWETLLGSKECWAPRNTHTPRIKNSGNSESRLALTKGIDEIDRFHTSITWDDYLDYMGRLT